MCLQRPVLKLLLILRLLVKLLSGGLRDWSTAAEDSLPRRRGNGQENNQALQRI